MESKLDEEGKDSGSECSLNLDNDLGTTCEDDLSSASGIGGNMKFIIRFAEYIDSLEFNQRCEMFFKERCHVVDLTLDNGEHTHEYFELYEEYQELVEDSLRDFVAAEHLNSLSELVGKLKAGYNTNDFAKQYIDFCISCMEFESFAGTLKQYWRTFCTNNNIPIEDKKRKKLGALQQEEESKHK